MSIKRILKKEGIEVIKPLDTLTVNTLAKNIANYMSNSFPALNLNVNELFRRISRLNMYFAKLPNGISAKYFYKNTSIYFDCNLDINHLPDVAIHECIHYLQEIHDDKGNIIKLGLCDYTNKKLPGTGLNEAAVQLMAVKALNMPYENVKYFDINFLSNTPTYYPLECALVNQLAYLVGEDILFDSTLNSNNRFKDVFISLTSENTFNKIQENIDLLVELQEELGYLYLALGDDSTTENTTKKILKEIEYQKSNVRKLFLTTQKLILTSYFDSSINLAYSPKALENYRNKLYLFKNIIAYSEGDNFYNDYYIDKMMQIEKRYEYNPMEDTSIAVVKHSFISTLIHKLKLLFGLDTEYEFDRKT